MATNVNIETGLIGVTPKYKFHDQVTVNTGDTIQDVSWSDCEYLAKFKKNSLGSMIVRPDYIYEDTAGNLARNGVTIVGVSTENTLARVTDPEVLRILLDNVSHTLEGQIRLAEVASGTIGAAWFAGNTKIEVFDCPRGYSVAASAFNGCTGLKEVFIQKNVSLGNSAFNGCSHVECYHFLDTNVGSFGTTVFNGLSGTCYLYVPNEAVVNYCKVSNLGTYINRIRGHIKGWHLICADGTYKYNLRDCYDTATNISFRLEGTYVTNLSLSVDPDTYEATVTVTGMLPDTDEDVELVYGFDYRNHHFSGYVPLHLKTGAAEIIEFEDPEVKRICVANWGGIYRMSLDGYEDEMTKEQAAKVSSIGTAFRGADNSNRNNYDILDMSMLTGVTSISTNHLAYLNATTVILPCNTRSVENYSIRNSRITNLVITYTAGTFAFNGSWNNSSSISYIYVPDTKISAYSGRTVYPIIGKESIIEKDREFSLSISSAKFGWVSDLLWSIEENDYISIVSQEDGVATLRATGISENTDTTVTLSYQSNNGNGFFKGTKVLTVKPTPVIEFEDAEVKRICVANWGGPLCISTKVPGVPGELTYEQAAAVSSIGTVFKSNSVIRRFNEFRYFTKVTTLANSAFEGSGIAQIMFPSTMTTLGTGTYCNCLSNCSNLVSVVFPEGLTFVHDRCFWGSRNITLIDLPSTTTTLQNYAIQTYHSSGQKNYVIICRAVTPPSLGSTSYTTKLTAVYVPDDSVSAYKAASVWSGIASIIKPISEYTGN